MVFLISLVRNKGADLATVHVATPPKDTLERLGFTPDDVINATGLGAKELSEADVIFPVRKTIKRIANKINEDFKPINEIYLVSAQVDPSSKDHIKTIFLVPRSDEMLIVDSIVQPYNDHLNLTTDAPDVEIMWKRARTFLPSLNDAEIIPEYPLGQGLRPFTATNAKVRADTSTGLNMVQNYGHGGSGWTLAVGYANTTVYLLEKIMEGETADEANKTVYGA